MGFTLSLLELSELGGSRSASGNTIGGKKGGFVGFGDTMGRRTLFGVDKRIAGVFVGGYVFHVEANRIGRALG